jgi:uncharacterized protein YuzE
MEKIAVDNSMLNEIFKITTNIVKFPLKKMWIDFDEEADVLYISFQRPQRATDSEMLENGILLRYSRDRLVGVTVLDASTRTYN